MPLLLAVLAGYWLLQYYLPACWAQKLEDDFLVQHQQFLRVDSLQRSSFGKFLLNNVKLGVSGKEVLTAPTAELQLDQKLRWRNPQRLALESLKLSDAELTVTANSDGIAVNNHQLREFAAALAELPAAPNGRFIPLQVNAKLKLGRDGEERQVVFFINREMPGKLRIKFSWQNGSGEAWFDLTNDIFNVTFNGPLNMQLWQETLLRSGLPPQAVRLLKKAQLQGSGKFSADLKKQSVSTLDCQIQITDGELDWYGQTLHQAGSLELALKREASGFTMTIPALYIKSPAPAEFKDTVLQYRPKQNTLQVQTSSDLRQLLLNIFCRHLNIPVIAVTSQPSQLSGSWNTRTGQWHISARQQNDAPADLAVDSSDHSRLVLTARSGDFQAGGTGKTGQMQHDFDFTKLELHTPQGISRVDRGKVYTRINFGGNGSMNENSMEFNFANFAADYGNVQFEIPGFAGELNLRTYNDSTREIYLITRGMNSQAMGKSWKLNLDNFQGTVNMQQIADQGIWKITNFNFTTPAGKAEVARQNIDFKTAVFRGNGNLRGKDLLSAGVYFSCEELASGACKLRRPVVNSDYDNQRPADRQYQVALTVENAALPENPWHIRKVQNGKLDFSASTLFAIPEEFKLQSDALLYQNQKITADLRKSLLKVVRDSGSTFTCTADFDSLKADTGDSNYGQGSFGKGNIKCQWQPNASGKKEKISASVTVKQSDWRNNTANINSEEAALRIDYDAQQNVAIKGSLALTRPALLSTVFNAIGNKLAIDFSGRQGDLSGILNFSGNSISSPNGDIELKDAVIKLPLTVTNRVPGKLPAGSITARQLLYKQQSEGKLSGQITHVWNPGKSEHTVTFDGNLAADKFNGKPFNIHSRWQLPPDKNAVEMKFDLAESDLMQPLNLNRYLVLPCNITALKGKFALNGNLSCQDKQPPQGSIKLMSTNSDWQLDSLTAQGVISNARMDIYNNKNIILPHTVSAGKIIWRNFVLQENELNIIGNASGIMQIANWQGKFAGGAFNLSQTLLLNGLQDSPRGATIPAANFEVHTIPAEKFFRSIGLKYLSGNMPLSGHLRPRLQAGELLFGQSTLTSRTPAGSLLKLDLPDKNMFKVRNKAYQNFAMAALKAFKTTQTQFDFTANTSEIAMQVKAEGTPAEPIDFVYTGSNPPFRPAEPGEKGFDGEIELNINLKLRPELPGF